jgi:hypothetical protein
MTSQEFLATVLPTSGLYCAVEISTAKKEHVFVNTIEELYTASLQFDEKKYNTFYALATFDGKKRLADNAVKIKSLFLDIDCGEGKDYANKADAARALDQFLIGTGLDLVGNPWIVSSGGGLHVYFPFAEEVDIATWKPVAENLKRLCKKEGFNIDASVTGDAARILRVPDTHNYKQDTPRKVAIKVKGDVFDFETLANHLRDAIGVAAYEDLPALQLPGNRPKLAPNANSVKLMENSVTFFKNITSCGQINYYKEHATDDGMEPLWRGILSLAKSCADGVEEGLALSAMHPYDLDRHNTKWNAIKGPYKCLKLDEANPGVCTNCPHYGKITTPLALGREIKVDNEPKEVVVDRIQEKEISANLNDETEPVKITRPTPPKGFGFGANGGVFMDRMVEDEQGGKSRKQVMLLPYDLFAVDILNNKGDHIVHLMAFRPDGAVDILIPQKSIVSKEETVKALANQNIIAAFGAGNDKNLFDYVRGCVEFISANKKAVPIPSSCGWQEGETFVYNSRIFAPDGTEVYVPTPALENINQSTKPTGTLDNWKKVFNMLVAKQEWQVLAMSLVGPASILMDFTGFNGCVYHLGSSKSGMGKSLALELAASFFGHPERYRVTQSTSIVASQQRQGLLNSLPFIIDETTNKSRDDFEWLPEFLLDLTQGKGKDRMKQGSNEERINDTTWKLLVLFSSNTHVMDFLSGARKHASQAEMFRILELQMNRKLSWTSEEAEALSLLKKNFGVAGRELIRWIVKNRETAKQVLEETKAKLKVEFESNEDERYWTAGNSCIVAIVQLLGKKYANIIDIPIKPIVEVLRMMVYSARGIIHSSERTAEDVLNAYTRERFGKFVMVKKTLEGKIDSSFGSEGVIDESVTRDVIAGRVEKGFTPGHIDYFIEEQLLKQHCVSMSFGYKDFKEALEKLPNYKVTTGKKKDMLAKTRGPSMRVNVMHICRPANIEDEED